MRSAPKNTLIGRIIANEEEGRVITFKNLSSGYILIRGNGPCNWAQVPYWPCDEEVLRDHMFPEASEAFLKEALTKG